MIRKGEAPVIAFALFVAVLAVVSAWFTDRNGDIDELGLYNPSYMLACYGKLTYPIHGYFDAPVIVHPPVHVGLIGLFARMGFTWYYAEATPTVLLFLLSIVVIVRSAFPGMVKLGLLFSAGFLMHTGERIGILFGTRPEGEVHAAWFAGLVLLESGRLAAWSRGRLFAGAFLLTWASGVHYYAAAALAGVGVYVVWVIRELGWKDGRSRVLALCGGGCLFGIPYLVLFIIPHWHAIFAAVEANRAGAGLAAAVRAHFTVYREWGRGGLLPLLLRGPAAIGLPLALPATAILAAVRSTRGIALAALPLELFVFFFAAHKQPCYLIHEAALFAAAVSIGLLMLGGRLASRLGGRWPEGVPAAAVVLLGTYLLVGNAALAAARFSLEPRVHEAELARAATRDLLGPHARIVSRLAVWYSSGAEHWHSVSNLLLDNGSYDVRRYLGNFDAAVDYQHFSGETHRPDRATLSSWYSDGTLKLRGFYFAELNEQLRFVLLSPRDGLKVAGYAARKGRLYRFDEDPAGDYTVLAAACASRADISPSIDASEVFASVLHVPTKAPGGLAALVTVLAPRTKSLHSIRNACKQITEIHGRMRVADGKALVDSLRRDDVPIQFYRKLEEVPGFTGLGVPPGLAPPQDTVRLGGVLDLSAIQLAYEKGRIEKSPRLRVITASPPPLGAFAAHIPVTHWEAVEGPCWVVLRLRVTAGRIGFAAWTPGKGMLARTEAHVSISAEPVDVALALPNLLETRYVTIFNASDDSASEVEVLDAAVVVSREEWERRRDVLAKVR